MRAGDETKAFKYFEAAVKASPDSFSAHGDLAFAAMKCGQSARAITHFEKSIELNPDFYPAWSFLEALYFEKRDYLSAVNAVKNLRHSIQWMRNIKKCKMHFKMAILKMLKRWHDQ